MRADCIYTDCMYTNRIDKICITVDCINANHVDTCNCDTIFCNTLDCAYEYAQVMLGLDFDNVKSNKSSQSCEYKTSLGADGMPDKLIKEHEFIHVNSSVHNVMNSSNCMNSHNK